MPKILLIKPSSFGDIVHGLQGIHSLREQRGDVDVTWVVRDVFAPLVAASTAVDRYLVYERKGGVGVFCRLLKAIRAETYDTVVDLQGLARSGVMTLAARAQEKIGRTDAREGAGLCYKRKMPLPPAGKHAHAVEILLELLPLLGCKARLEGKLAFRAAAPRSFETGLLARGPIVLFPESRRAEKMWAGFACLTGLLLDAYGDRAVVWAGSGTMAPPEDWPADRFVNLMGKTALDEVVTLVAGARLLIANDSGPMHLAAALGAPVLGLFGPTLPERFGPYPLDRPGNRVIRAPDGDMNGMEAGAVFEVVSEMMATAP